MIQIVTESLDFHSDMLHRQNFPNKIFMLSKYELYTMLMIFGKPAHGLMFMILAFF